MIAYPPFSWPRRMVAPVIVALITGILAGVLTTSFPPFFAAVGVLGALAALGMLFSPRVGILAGIVVAVLLPFGVIPFRLGATFSFLELILALLFVMVMLRLLSGKMDKLESTPINVLLLIFIGFSVFSFILGIRQAYSTDTLHNYFKMLMSILFFFSIVNLVRTRQVSRQVITAVIVAGSISALLGIVLYVINHSSALQLLSSLRIVGYPSDGNVLRFIEDDPAKPMRAISTSVDPNSFGGMLVLVLGLVVGQIASSKPVMKKGFLLVMGALVGIALLLTYSRAAWLGAVAVILFIMTMKQRRLWLLVFPAAGAFMFLVWGGQFTSNIPFVSRLMAGLQLQDKATLMRLSEYQNALDIIKQYPLFGVGFGTAPSIDLTTGVSSIYLTIGERMGLIGLSFFLLIALVYLLKSVSHSEKIRDASIRADVLGFQAGVVGALVVGLLDHYFFNIEFSHMVALFWLFGGMTFALLKIGDREEERDGVLA